MVRAKVVTVMTWYAQDEMNQEESEQKGWRNEEGSWFHRWGDAYLKEWLVICNEEDADGWARVTAEEERTEQTSDCVGSQIGWM